MEDEPVWIVKKVIGIHGYDKIAEALDVSTRTVRRWEAGQTGISRSEFLALEQMALQFFAKHKQRSDFTFVDLFAGIGGLRMAFEEHGGECIFTSEWDEYCQKTYLANFRVDHELAGDINVIVGDVRKHIPVAPDVLVAGFPCQPFSIAGVDRKSVV